MAGAPILTGPVNAWQRQGWEAEDKSRDETRLQKMKALKEMADQAASEGREMSVDEWFNMANSTIGPAGVLNGTAPSSSILESMRQNANQRAQQVEADRRFQASQRDFQLDDQVRSRVEEMARSGADPVEITTAIHDAYGAERAAKYAPRINSYIAGAQAKDQQTGMQMGQTIQTADEAEKYIAANGQFQTDGWKTGVRNAAKVNEMRNDTLVAQIAGEVGQRGGYSDDQATRQYVLSRLPTQMQTPEYVDKVMKSAQGITGIDSRQRQTGITDLFRTGIAQNAWQVPSAEAEFQRKDDAYLQDKLQNAERQTASAIDAQNKAVQMPLQKAMGSKNAAVAKQASEVSALLGSSIVPPREQQDLYAALDSGDESKLRVAIGNAQKVAVSRDAFNQAQREMAAVAAGKLTGTPQEMFVRTTNIGMSEGDRIMSARGAAIRSAMGDANLRGVAKTQLTDALNAVVRSVEMTRATLGESGQFQATASEMQQMEQQSMRRMLMPLAQSSGFSVDDLMADVMRMYRPPSDIVRRAQPRDTFTSGYGTGLMAAGLPGIGGAGGRAPAPTGGSPYSAPAGDAPQGDDPLGRAQRDVIALQNEMSNPRYGAGMTQEQAANRMAILRSEMNEAQARVVRLSTAAPAPAAAPAAPPAGALASMQSAPQPAAAPAAPPSPVDALQAQLRGMSTIQLYNSLQGRASQSMKLAIQAELIRRDHSSPPNATTMTSGRGWK